MSTYVLISKMRIDVTKNIYICSFHILYTMSAYSIATFSLSTLPVTHTHPKIVIQIN